MPYDYCSRDRFGKVDWTDEKIGIVEKMWMAGHSAKEIGAAIGTSRNSIIGKVHRLGLARYTRKTILQTGQVVRNGATSMWTAENVAKLTAMWLTASAKDIAEALGSTVSAVQKKGHLLHLPNKNKNQIARKLAGFVHRPRKTYAPLPVPAVSLSAPDMKPVDLFARTGCCFPVNDGGPFLFCNNPKEKGSYCGYHAQVMVKRVL